MDKAGQAPVSAMKLPYPPRRIHDFHCYYYEKPDISALFESFYPKPHRCIPEPRSGTLAEYFTSILKHLGILIPIFSITIVFDVIHFYGCLTGLVLATGYFKFIFTVSHDQVRYKERIKKREEELVKWRNNIPEMIRIFEDLVFVSLESYKDNKIGKSALNFHQKLACCDIFGVMEAVPIGEPYQMRNGVYSADIGINDKAQKILLDIEIDEKYHFNEDQKRKDDYRNEFFLSKGWAVVRFSEFEIVHNMIECIDDIDWILQDLADDYAKFLSALSQKT